MNAATDKTRTSMKTRAALLAAISLCLAVLLPAAAIAKTEEETDDGKVKTKTVKVVSVGDTHGFLGVGVADLDEDKAKELGLREDYGVVVNSVVKGSAAEKAGVKKGDVVLEYNGAKVESNAQFIRMIRETRIGRQIKLLVFRDGKTTTLTGTMEKRQPRVVRWKTKDGESGVYSLLTPEGQYLEGDDITIPDVHVDIPDIDIQIPDIPTPSMFWRTPRLGVETEGLGQQLADFFGVKEGVLVRSVVKDSAAEKAGLKAGDVIVKLGGETVSRPGDISSVLRSSEATDVPVVVVRNRRELTLTAKIDRTKGASNLPKKRTSLYMNSFPTSGSDWDGDWDGDFDFDFDFDEGGEDGDDL